MADPICWKYNLILYSYFQSQNAKGFELMTVEYYLRYLPMWVKFSNRCLFCSVSLRMKISCNLPLCTDSCRYVAVKRELVNRVGCGRIWNDILVR